MKNYFTDSFNGLKVTVLLLFIATASAISQQTGVFDKTIDIGGENRQISFYVPGSGAPSKGFPLIIGMHPAGTPASIMRQMLQPSAEAINAILACPEGPDGDGKAIMPLVDYVKKTYKVDSLKVILTGYSAGGYPTFQVGLNYVSAFRGLIGIAPAASTYGLNMSAVPEVCIAIIVGKNDQMYNGIKTFMDALISAGGITKFVEKSGVGHTGQYFWGPEFTTDWTDCYNFCINTPLKPKQVILSQPVNNSEDLPLNTTLTWLPAKNAASYKIEISTSKGIFKNATSTKESYTPAGMQKNTTYTWKVCGVNGTTEGPWSESWSFTTLADPPTTAAVLVEPVNDADLAGTTIAFKWRKVQNAKKYHFQIYDFVTMELVYEDSLIISSDTLIIHEVSGLDSDTKFKWQVRGYNAAGSAPWSEDRFFTTMPEPPNAPSQLQEPGHNATGQPLTLSLKWKVVLNAEKYHLQVTEKKSNIIIINDSDITKPTVGDLVETTISGLSNNSTYKWRVSGYNRAGYGPWSVEWNFTTEISGIEENQIGNNLKIEGYPNPSYGKLNLFFDNAANGRVRIEINDPTGTVSEVILDKALAQGKTELFVNLEKYSSGLYFIKIIQGNRAGFVSFILCK